MSQSRGKAYTNKTSLDSSTNTSKSSARNDNQNSDVEKMGNSLKKWLVGSKEEPKEGAASGSSKESRKRKSKNSYKTSKNIKAKPDHELSPSPTSKSGGSDWGSSDTEKYSSDESQEAHYWNIRTRWAQKDENEKLKDRLRLVSQWSKRDTREYRDKYPGKLDMENLQDNYLFYTNQLASKPDGEYIDDILEDWKGNYSKLERHHGYIQWLFPIRETGMNWQSQELQLHEAKKIIEDKLAKERFVKSYELMLDFYGLRLKDRESGQIERAENWEARLSHLNRSYHNYLRITRILKSMGELGCEHMKFPFVKFLLNEAIHEHTISNAAKSCVEYWVQTLRNKQERAEILQHVKDFIESDANSWDKAANSEGGCGENASTSRVRREEDNDVEMRDESGGRQEDYSGIGSSSATGVGDLNSKETVTEATVNSEVSTSESQTTQPYEMTLGKDFSSSQVVENDLELKASGNAVEMGQDALVIPGDVSNDENALQSPCDVGNEVKNTDNNHGIENEKSDGKLGDSGIEIGDIKCEGVKASESSPTRNTRSQLKKKEENNLNQ